MVEAHGVVGFSDLIEEFVVFNESLFALVDACQNLVFFGSLLLAKFCDPIVDDSEALQLLALVVDGLFDVVKPLLVLLQVLNVSF